MSVATDFVPSIDARLYESTKSFARAEDLERLARDEDPRVRLRVALHENTSHETRAKLASDEDSRVRWAVASSLHTHNDILLELVEDEDRNVAAVALAAITD